MCVNCCADRCVVFAVTLYALYGEGFRVLGFQQRSRATFSFCMLFVDSSMLRQWLSQQWQLRRISLSDAWSCRSVSAEACLWMLVISWRVRHAQQGPQVFSAGNVESLHMQLHVDAEKALWTFACWCTSLISLIVILPMKLLWWVAVLVYGYPYASWWDSGMCWITRRVGFTGNHSCKRFRVPFSLRFEFPLLCLTVNDSVVETYKLTDSEWIQHLQQKTEHQKLFILCVCLRTQFVGNAEIPLVYRHLCHQALDPVEHHLR